MKNSIEDIVASLPESEKELHKDLIEECRQRETKLKITREYNKESLRKLNKVFEEYMTESRDAESKIDEVLGNLNKLQDSAQELLLSALDGLLFDTYLVIQPDKLAKA